MKINEKKFKIVPRTEGENESFLSFLSDAEDRLQQAVGTITYLSDFGELNSSVQEEIKRIIGDILSIEESISEGHIKLYKPQQIN